MRDVISTEGRLAAILKLQGATPVGSVHSCVANGLTSAPVTAYHTVTPPPSRQSPPPPPASMVPSGFHSSTGAPVCPKVAAAML